MSSFYSRQCLNKLFRQIHKYSRRLYTTDKPSPHIAIIGSGPAGFYTAQQLLKGNSSIKVDIYEKLPVPFGLVRFGVAPDHPEVKNVINTFTQTAENSRCSFIGNVTIGQDITVADLQKAYTAVVLSYGADADRTLNIPGENLPNVISARALVGWYNGLPQDKNLNVDLSCKTAVILGHGNVALDVARILITPVSLLSKTDISQHSLEALSKSKIEKVYIVGRRGPLQVSFTIKELREMIQLPECRTVINSNDVAHLETVISDLPRPRRRLTELLYKTGCKPSDKDIQMWSSAKKEWELKFLRSPVEITSSDNKIKSILFKKNVLQGDDMVNQKAHTTNEMEEIECGLVLRSIGYKSIPIDGTVPFDAEKGIIPNENGRVMGTKGLYCSGWVGLGPVGVILSTMTDGFNTGKIVLKDLEAGLISSDGKNGKGEILPILNQKGVKTTSFEDWKLIDESETKTGGKVGKPREKITSVEEMMKVTKS